MANISLPEPTDEKQPFILTESEPSSESSLESDSEIEEHSEPKQQLRDPSPPPPLDPRFNPPTPSPFKRAALIVFILLLFWLALSLRRSIRGDRKAQVIYASRYSKEHKFRPAASPIITETLKDGRVRIRGGAPTATPEPPKPTPITKSKARAKAKAKIQAKRRNPAGKKVPQRK